MNSGHGHVFPRTDGVKARCGGPAICKECALDLATKTRNEQQSQYVLIVSDGYISRAEGPMNEHQAVTRRAALWDTDTGLSIEMVQAGVWES